MEKNLVLELVKTVNEKLEQGCPLTPDIFKPFLNERITVRVIPKGTYFVMAGQSINYIYYIVQGSYYLMRNSDGGRINLAAKKEVPQFVGLRSINDPKELFFANHYALEPCLVIEFDKHYFWKCVRDSGELGIEVIKNLEASLFTAANRSDHMIFFTAKEKLMLYILEYREKYRTAEGPCVVNVKNEFIADAIGVNIRTLYRIIDELKQEGLVTVKKRNMIVTEEQIAIIRQSCEILMGNLS